jgi:putative peptide zinc metalloprotease protein
MPEVVRLKPNLARIKRDGGQVILVDPKGVAPAVRLSPVADQVMPLLLRGAATGEMAAHLSARYPAARDVHRKLEAFLGQLGRSGMLDSVEAAPRRRPRAPRFPLVDPDPVAHALARFLARVPRLVRRAVLYMAILSAAGAIGWVLARDPLRPQLVGIARDFELAGLLVFILVLLPLHELAHAIACRAAGVPVRRAGLVLHGYLVPGPYVDTSDAYLVRERGRRFLIPAAGPLIDLLVAGAAAGVVIATGGVGPWAGPAAFLLLLALLILIADLNPFGPTDGSHMLEAWLDDELARVTALGRGRSRMSPVSWKYRLACMAWLAMAAAMVAVLLQEA